MLTILLFAAMYISGCVAYADKGFTKLQVFLDILKNNAGLICVVCGMTAVMITGGIDISVGALIAMESGCEVTDINGDPLTFDGPSSILCASEGVSREAYLPEQMGVKITVV